MKEKSIKEQLLDAKTMGASKLEIQKLHSRFKIINLLMRNMCELDAIDYAEFNIFNSLVGDLTPIYIDDFTGY